MTTKIIEDKYRGLSGYINEEGKFHRLPGKRKKKTLDATIECLGEKFDYNKGYTEVEVNDLLA